MARDLASSTPASPIRDRPAAQPNCTVDQQAPLDSNDNVTARPSAQDMKELPDEVLEKAAVSSTAAIANSSASTTAASSTTLVAAVAPFGRQADDTCAEAARRLEALTISQGSTSNCGDGSRKLRARRSLAAVLQAEDSHDRQLLVQALARVLLHLSNLGLGRPSVATGFHAVSPPALDIAEYLGRISHYYFCSDACLVLGLVYIDRLMKLHPEFVVNPLSIHRLIATSTTVAAKFFDDDYFANSYYSRVAGVRLRELNTLEAQFLQLLQWRLHVSNEEYDSYKGHLDNVQQALKAAPPPPTVVHACEPNVTRKPHSNADEVSVSDDSLQDGGQAGALLGAQQVGRKDMATSTVIAKPPPTARPQLTFRSNARFSMPRPGTM